MERIKKPKLRTENAELLWEKYIFTGLHKDETPAVMKYYRDSEGYYWKRIDGEGILLNTALLMNDLCWFYAADAERGDLRSSNNQVAWKSKTWDINRIIEDVCDPKRCAQLEAIRKQMYG